MSKKTIVFLGGSPDQSTSYLAARDMGLHIIGFDGNPGAFAFQYADEAFPISVHDDVAIKDALAGRQIDAIYSQASDAGRMCEYELARVFHTPKPVSLASVHASMDKGYFLESLAQAGLPAHGHVKCSGKEQMLHAVKNWAFPFVVKPNDSSGSKGVLLVRDAQERDAAIADAAAISPTNTLICEQLVEGQHYSVDCFIRDHKVEFMAVSQKFMTTPPLMIPMHYVMPAEISDELQERMRSYVERICAALDITAGPVTCDVVLSNDGILHIIEMGARAGGNGLSLLLDRAYGVDYVPAAVALHLGEAMPVGAKYSRASALITIVAHQEGKLMSIAGLDTLKSDGTIADFKCFFEVGQDVAPYTKAANALGYILLEGTDNTELARKIDQLRERVLVEVDTGRGICKAPLDAPTLDVPVCLAPAGMEQV
jgi:biotin carboxylase